MLTCVRSLCGGVSYGLLLRMSPRDGPGGLLVRFFVFFENRRFQPLSARQMCLYVLKKKKAGTYKNQALTSRQKKTKKKQELSQRLKSRVVTCVAGDDVVARLSFYSVKALKSSMLAGVRRVCSHTYACLFIVLAGVRRVCSNTYACLFVLLYAQELHACRCAAIRALRIYTCMCVFMYISISIYIYIYIDPSIMLSIYMYIYKYIYFYFVKYICISFYYIICVYIYVYIYT